MKTILKWIAIVVGGLIGLIVALLFLIVLLTSSKMNQDFSDVQVVAINIPTDQVSIDHGEHIFQSFGLCAECHGDNAGGDIFNDDPVFGRLVASNLTSGKGGVGGTFEDIDYLRAIRHGVGLDRKPLIIMPSQHFAKFSDRDVSSLIAYIRSVPPVDNELPTTKMALLGRVFAMMLSDELLPATGIDHTAGRDEPAPGVTQEYGKYMAEVCSACHFSDFAGGPSPGAEPGAPEAANITILTQSEWTGENFAIFLRTGLTHYGKQVDNEHMPWERFANLTDDELQLSGCSLAT